MEQSQKSSLSFSGFKILKSSIEINEEKRPSEIEISFGLRGEIKQSEGSFKLYLRSLISDSEKAINIDVETLASFVIDKEGLADKNYMDFVLLNSPAILFPYIRAYITSLTSLSGINPIQIPIMNMTNLKGILENNLVVIDSKA